MTKIPHSNQQTHLAAGSLGPHADPQGFSASSPMASDQPPIARPASEVATADSWDAVIAPSASLMAATTRERVLAAAGELFAKGGFRDTTVRDIKDLAGANIAAVNYHFRDKNRLHLEALRRAFEYTRDNVLEPSLSDPRLSPQAQLRLLVSLMLDSLLSETRPAWHVALVMRELGEPTDNFRALVREFVLPAVRRLEALVASLRPPDGQTIPPRQLRLMALSMCAQCSYFRLAKPLVLEMLGLVDYTPAVCRMLVDHIYEFTLAAIRCVSALNPADLATLADTSSGYQLPGQAESAMPTAVCDRS